MNNRGKLWVIPNDDIVDDIFYKNVDQGKSHTYYLKEFSNKYNLGYNFTEEDYQDAPLRIAEVGNLVIKSEDSVGIIVCFIPSIVTDKQYEWLYQNQSLFNNYIQVSAYSLKDDEWVKIHGINEIMMIAGKKNLKYENGRSR